MSFSLQDYCCIVGKFVFYHPSHCLCPSCPAICYLHQTIFFHLLIRNILYTQSHMNSNIQELGLLSSILLCASNGVDCRVESSISPGARLHDMIIIANQVQSTEIFHPPILIPVLCLYCCVCCYDLNIHIHKYALSCYTSNVSSHVYCWIWSSPIFIPKLIVMCVPNQTISPIFIDTDSTTDVPQPTNTAHISHILLSLSLGVIESVTG